MFLFFFPSVHCECVNVALAKGHSLSPVARTVNAHFPSCTSVVNLLYKKIAPLRPVHTCDRSDKSDKSDVISVAPVARHRACRGDESDRSRPNFVAAVAAATEEEGYIS